MTEMPAYADESIRGNRYLMAVVILDSRNGGGECRELIRAKARSMGRSSLHFSRLLPAQRTESLALLAELTGLRSKVFEHRKAQGEKGNVARAVVLGAMVRFLQQEGVTSLMLDQFQGAEQTDGRIISQERSKRPATLTYSHRHFGDEPLLWIADGIAYNAGAKQPAPFPAWHEGTEKV